MSNYESWEIMKAWVKESIIEGNLAYVTTNSVNQKYPLITPIKYVYDHGKIIMTSSVFFNEIIVNLKENPEICISIHSTIGNHTIQIQGKATVNDLDQIRKNDDLIINQQFSELIGTGIRESYLHLYLKRTVIIATPERITAWKSGNLTSEPVIYELEIVS
ncbi:MAG: pyridoxamine 5'-phosphate oxidase family protein [Candidatus Kariarchaeaceae archaeon]